MFVFCGVCVRGDLTMIMAKKAKPMRTLSTLMSSMERGSFFSTVVLKPGIMPVVFAPAEHRPTGGGGSGLKRTSTENALEQDALLAVRHSQKPCHQHRCLKTHGGRRCTSSTVSVPGNTPLPMNQPACAPVSTCCGLLRRQSKTTKNQESMKCETFFFSQRMKKIK